MTNKELAELMYPNVKETIEDIEKRYPKRNLKEGAIVSRYAPSPTGFVHFGNMLSCFIESFIPKKNGGIFYLRIEDTDQKREVDGGVENVINSIKALGIEYSEGVMSSTKQIGEYGPYIQSQRKEIYDVFAKYMIENDIAYPCFCTEEEIQEIREYQTAKKMRIGYYGRYARCRYLSNEERAEKIKAGQPYTIRLKSTGNFDNKFKLIEKEDERTLGSNDKLKELLKLDKLTRIDLFDNSNLFGTFAVSAMVVFINGKPAKSEYRKYKILVDKNDDYHTMQEVIYRRYNKAMIENLELPDLILVDGGITQIHATKEVLSDLGLNINVAGLKKDNKHNTNTLIDLNEEEIELDITSNLFHYLTRMQDEVHNFAINYHRQIRSKGQIESILDNIAGIGDKRKKELIKKYKTINNILNAPDEELSDIIPISVVNNLKNYLSSIKEGSNHENN